MNNLPNVSVTDLQIFYPNNLLRASTYGRGAWESQIPTSNTLPVTWLFGPTAQMKHNQTYIGWSVAAQFNNEKFIIEHSTDLVRFSEIGMVKGDPNLETAKSYEFIHLKPTLGENYYRIKQIDFDGLYDYSKIVHVFHESDEINLRPNPANSIITLFNYTNGTALITDLYGRTIRKVTISKGENIIDIGNLAKGIYSINVGKNKKLFIKL